MAIWQLENGTMNLNVTLRLMATTNVRKHCVLTLMMENKWKKFNNFDYLFKFDNLDA